MRFMRSVIRKDGKSIIALSPTERVEISGDGSPSECSGPRKPLTWPSILRDDPQHQPFIRICESCPNFSVRRDGCPTCKLFKGCAKLGKFGQAILKREWPEGCPQREARAETP